MRAAAGAGLTDLLHHDFIRHALLGGTGIALAAGIVGWFLVLRLQVFAADALGHVAYTGAIGALAFGASARFGLFAATAVLAVALALLGRHARADDVVIGSAFAWVLGLGALFLSIYTTSKSSANGHASVNYLFGSIYGLSAGQAWVAFWLGLGVTAAVVLIARPLLFASLDQAVALARGVPVRMLGAAFLLLVGVTTAEASQAVGALLVLGLVSAPAGAAHRLARNPYAGIALSGGIAVFSVWLGLVVAYLADRIPPSFAIMAVATGCYLLAVVGTSPVLRRAVAGRLAEPGCAT
jgi:zinc/manganese transport system permease protein